MREREREGESFCMCVRPWVFVDRQRQRFSARPLFQSQSRAKSNLPPLVLLNFRSAAKSPTNVAVSTLILNRRPGCLTVCFADRILRQCFLFCSLLAHNYKAPLKFWVRGSLITAT